MGLSGGEAKWAVVERQCEWAQVVERPSGPRWIEVNGPRCQGNLMNLVVLRNLCPRRPTGPRG